MTNKTMRENKKLIDRKAFAVRLKALRKESGLTQIALAERIGSTRSGVTNWENGTRFPESRFVDAMARLYGVSIDYMYGASNHRYKIDTFDYFELDLGKLNEYGIVKLYDYYKLLMDSPNFTNKGL